MSESFPFKTHALKGKLNDILVKIKHLRNLVKKVLKDHFLQH